MLQGLSAHERTGNFRRPRSPIFFLIFLSGLHYVPSREIGNTAMAACIRRLQHNPSALPVVVGKHVTVSIWNRQAALQETIWK